MMARRKQQGLAAKQARAEALVRELKALRAEIAEEEKALRRERADQALQRLERLGLVEALLGLEETQCQQVEQAEGVGPRCQVLARLFEATSDRKGSAEDNDQRVGFAPSVAVPQGGSVAGSEQQRAGGLFSR